MTGLIEIKREIVDLVPVGLYLVSFETIYGNHCNEGKHECCIDHGCLDNGSEYIAEIKGNVEKITKDNYLKLGVNVVGKDDTLNNDNSIFGDTHDLRPRLFKTKKEAKEHLDYTEKRFKNPQVWESFVKL